jgi:hypothetical protein
VVVYDLRPEWGQPLGQLLDTLAVIELIDHGDIHAGPLEASDAAAMGQRDDSNVIAFPVQTGHEGVDVFLRATVGPGGHHLDDSDPASLDRPAVELLDAGIVPAYVGAHG